MAINPVSSSSSQASSISARPPVRAEKDNDGDKDDSSSKMNAAKPTINGSGQTIGTTISVKA